MSRSLKLFTAISTLKFILLLAIILFAGIGLGPDEAQYWTWSRILDWGYYSKPPGIAWEIALGTSLFGSTELGVRFMPLLFSVLQGFLIYWLTIKAGLQSKTALWSASIFALSPIGILGGLLATTDGGVLLFWTLGCIAIFSTESHPKAPILLGFSILFGSLFKWPIYLLWIPFFYCAPKYFHRPFLKFTIAGLLISLLGLLPSLYWNYSHDWATFKHVSSTLQGGHGNAKGNPLDFFGSQLILFSPVPFVFFLIGCYRSFKERQQLSPWLFFSTITSFIVFLIAVVMSIFQKIQGNWIVFIYPTAALVAGWYTCEYHLLNSKKKKWAVIVSIIFTIIALLCVKQVPFKSNPIKHALGYESVVSILKANGYDPHNHFLISDKYQTVSLLSFYGEHQKLAYFLNLQGTRRNQFSYWPSYKTEQKGKTGFFVIIENEPYLSRLGDKELEQYENNLLKYFVNVEYVGEFPLVQSNDSINKAMFLFRCEGFIDYQEESVPLF